MLSSSQINLHCLSAEISKQQSYGNILHKIHKILLITLRHINVLHEDIPYIQYYVPKWSYIIKKIKHTSNFLYEQW